MPSRPPFGGVAVPSCAGIRANGTTIRAINALNGVDGKSLPLIQSMEELDGCTSDAFGSSDIVVVYSF
jgi:hypothetical protein